MDTKKASRVSWKHIVLSILLLIIFVLTLGVHVNADGIDKDNVQSSTSVVRCDITGYC